MNNEQQEKMLSTGRLILTKKRLFDHYEILVYLGLPMCIALIAFVIFQAQDEIRNIISPRLILLSLPAMGLAIFINQYSALRLIKVNTSLSKQGNYEAAKETIKQLKWNLKIDNKGFLEAFNPFSDIRTWGDEMISIVITDHQILITSICNLDTRISQAALSFGKNRQNIKKFCTAFSSIAKPKMGTDKATIPRS